MLEAKDMGMDCLLPITEMNMKGNGRMIKEMGQARQPIIQEIYILAIGRTAKEMEWLSEAMNHLSDDLRETAVLVVGEGLNHAEAGKIMGIKESTVSWRMHELKKQLREIVKEEAA